MKTFTKIILSIALGAIVILSIVVASVAWFTSNPEVNANEVTLESARTLTVSFASGVDESNGYLYGGQQGNAATGDDAPFVYEAGGFTIDVSPSGDSRYGRVKVEFGTVSVVSPIGTVSDVLITDLFHIDAKIYEPTSLTEEEGLYVKDPIKNCMRAYVSVTDDVLPRYRLISEHTIADDGIVMNAAGTQVEYFSRGTYYLGFTYTFLPETAYRVWTEACAEPPTKTFEEIHGYEYSSSGNYIGVISYTPYQAKYHYGLTRYARSGDAAPYTYTESDEGAYVRVVTSYELYGSVTKYTSAAGAGEGSANGEFIKVGDSNDYVRYARYNEKNGFPYYYHIYQGTEYRFVVACSVEEVSREA